MKRNTQYLILFVTIFLLQHAFTCNGLYGQVPEFDGDKPTVTFTNEYNQAFNPTEGWDQAKFYDQWEAIQADIFTEADISNGYLQFFWIPRRIICSRNMYPSPYIFETDLDHSAGSNRGGIVIRADKASELLQEPIAGDPGYNSEGIAFYPTSDGSAMIVQFTGVHAGSSTPVTRIQVTKPEGTPSTMGRKQLRIEDYDSTIYVYYSESPFIRIDLENKIDGVYTSGTVYDQDMQVIGSFTGMEVEAMGKIAVAQRDAALRLYSASLKYIELEEQIITFEPVGKKYTTDPPFTISADASSGLPVEYEYISGPATQEGTELTLTGETGIVEIMVSQSGNNQHYPAPEIRILFYVVDPASENVAENSQDYVDTWVATDALDRKLPGYEDAGSKRDNKLVGVFYYTWHGYHNTQSPEVFSIPEIIRAYPSDPLSAANPAWGPINAFHFWGEPEYGYFRSQDTWMLRRDLQMLSNARVDFLYIDVTNGFTYLPTVKALCEISMEMRAEGIYTPQIVFTSHFGSGNVINELYDEFYSHQLYKELWFYWEGKPLILGDEKDPVIRDELKDFFTIKYSWAWTNTKTEPDHWQWVDSHPQDFGWSTDPSVPEQIPVAVAQHPTSTIGTSFHDKKQPPVNSDYVTEFTGQGLHFEEQWERALEVDPPVVMVTQWNEWVAQRFIRDQGSGTYAGKPIKDGDSYFVDAFTEEFNRDMAPMKGGHTDNYYYQFISYVRKFKGMAAPLQFSEPATITIDGDVSEWDNIQPVFKDPPGDVEHRNFPGWNPSSVYVNTTGRNDIIESRVSYDIDNIYFYVKTSDPLSSHTDPNWMLLLLDVDRNKGTGWEGYDFVINKEILSSSETTLKKWNGSDWVEITNLSFSVSQNSLELSVPRDLVFLGEGTPEFYFKWADNPQHLEDVSAFFLDGESAPDRRFNFNYSLSEPDEVPQTPYKAHSIPGIIESEDFDNGGPGVAYSDATIGNSGEAYRTDVSVDIEENPEGGYFITEINSGEWLEYTFDVNAIGTFNAKIVYASDSTENLVTLKIDDTDRSGEITLPASGATNIWTFKDVEIRLNAGKHILRVFVDKAHPDFNLDFIEFSEKDVVYPGDGTGLTRSLWKSSAGGRTHFVDSVCAEIVSFIDEAWEDVSPGCEIENDFWNARWEGEIEALFSEEHTFYLTVNDIGSLWIKDELVIDAWASEFTNKTVAGTIDLTAGERVPIRVDFAERTAEAHIKLEWESPSILKEVVPSSQLYPMEINTGMKSYISGTTFYPNPVTDMVTIESKLEIISEISVIDMQGRKVFHSKEAFEGTKSFQLNLESGLYLLKIKCDGQDSFHRIVISSKN